MPRHGPLPFRPHWPPPTTALAPQRHRDPTRRSRAGGNPGQGRTRGAVPTTNISHFPLQVRLHPGGNRDPGAGQPRDRPPTPFPPIPLNSPLVIHHPRSSFLPPFSSFLRRQESREGVRGNPTTNHRRNPPPPPPQSRRRHAPYPDTGPGSRAGATPRPTPDAIPTHPPQLPPRHPSPSFVIPTPLLVIPAKAGIQRGGGRGNPTTNPRRNPPPPPPPSRRKPGSMGGATPQPTPVAIPHPLPPLSRRRPGSMGGATPRPTPDAIPTHPPQLPSRHPSLSFVIPAPFSSFLRRQESRGAGGGATPQPTTVTIPHPLRLHPGGSRDPWAGQPRGRHSGHPPHPLGVPVQLCHPPPNPDTSPLPQRRRLRYRLPMENANAPLNGSIRYVQPDRPLVFSLAPSSLSEVGYAKGESEGKTHKISVLNLKCDTSPTKPRGNNLRRSYGRIMDKSKRMAGAVIPAEGVDTQPPARHVGLNRHARLKRTCCTS